MIGQILTTASGRKSYEIYEASDEIIFRIIDIVQEQFGFTSHLPVWGMDEIYIDCKRPDAHITVGWDNWSGVFIMATTPTSDGIIEEIGDYLNSIFHDIGSM